MPTLKYRKRQSYKQSSRATMSVKLLEQEATLGTTSNQPDEI